ncbi:general secretion pathway protein [Allopusillimonas soli]|uniref:General secretion pathway protein n=1 Tax=Allopusillimonas soli TaxID=659016 RepID=A0A853FB53_9BURK|nr:general secretion pathway protein [Allopusillimonas soli]NYT36998.1 general secretion pathway protein [Allopusillimonas soli]TEA75443.1 general secretion pathway protein [Allopusillimonas soli]
MMGLQSNRVVFHRPWWSGLRMHLDAYRFRSGRGEYCDYLACLLQGQRGSQTLREIFRQDARRHGRRSVRGRLSAAWLQAYEASGADLYMTWRHCFPQGELAAIRSAQAVGNEALTQTLRALAGAADMESRLRRIVASALWSACVAIALLVLMLLAVPWFTVPRLMQVFSSLPPALHGQTVQGLIAFAAVVDRWCIPLALTAIAAWIGVRWSLPNAVGPVRSWLDQFALWRLYRHMQGTRLLSLLVILLGEGAEANMRLRTALRLLGEGATPWLAYCANRLRQRVDAGYTGGAIFRTGLLDREDSWFLDDMICARGLREGLSFTVNRLCIHMLRNAARLAVALRWVLLLGVLAAMLGLCLWHYAAIDEMRRTITLFHAGQ